MKDRDILQDERLKTKPSTTNQGGMEHRDRLSLKPTRTSYKIRDQSHLVGSANRFLKSQSVSVEIFRRRCCRLITTYIAEQLKFVQSTIVYTDKTAALTRTTTKATIQNQDTCTCRICSTPSSPSFPTFNWTLATIGDVRDDVTFLRFRLAKHL